jgi:ubiquinone/menaquinone biosynthesis C-methylase UbiE
LTGGKLEVDPFTFSGNEILEGRLVEAGTGNWYRIEDGIADLTPAHYRDADRHAAFCKKHRLDQNPVPTEPIKRDANATKQIKFFSNYKHGYEVDVVESPFYQILYRTTVDRWLQGNLKKGASVVEVGCGSGHQTLHILRRGGDVVGVDLSEEMLRMARRKIQSESFVGHADFVIGTAENLPLCDASFDAAVICGSLHHFSDPPAALLKLTKTLKTGGKIYLLEPHKSPVRFIFDLMMRQWPLWQEEANEDPLFQASQLRAWLKAGEVNCSIRYSTYLPPHLFYFVKGRAGHVLLSTTDRIFSSVPWVRRLAGVIIVEGTKAT